MSIQKQPKLLLLIYALMAVLAGILVTLLYLNPWAPETPAAIRCDPALAQADLSMKNGHLLEAERYCLDALKLIETSSDEFQRARALHALGLTYIQEKKLPAAEQTLRRALASLDHVIARNEQTVPGKPIVDNLHNAQQKYAVIEGDLASVLTDLSRYSEAESTYQSALKTNDLYLGSLEVQSKLSDNLAKVLLKDGKNAAAEELGLESEANELATKDLMAEITYRLQDLANGKMTRPAVIRSLKAIALSAKRRNKDFAYMDAQQYIGRSYLVAGQIPEAKQALQVVFNYVSARHPDAHDEAIWLARARISRAICCQLTGEKAEARELLKQASLVDTQLFITLLQSHLNEAISEKNGEHYLLTVLQLYQDAHLENLEKQTLKPNVLNDFATLFDSIGCQWGILKHYDEANVFIHRALEIYVRLGKANSSDAASILNHLARVANLTGKYAEAERYYKQSLTIFAKVKPQSPQVAILTAAAVSSDLAELASVYCNLQDFDRAEIYYKKAFDNDVKNHNSNWLIILGQYYQSLGDYKKAKLAYQRALVASTSIPDTPKETIALIQSRYDAIQVFQSDPRADLLVQQGKRYVQKDNLQQARAAFMEASKITSQKYGVDSVESAQSSRDIADIYLTHLNYENAAEYYQRAYSIFNGKHVPVSNRFILSTATSYLKRKNPGKKIEDAKMAIELLNKLIAEIDTSTDQLTKPLLSTIYMRLAECYVTQKMYVEAESNYVKSLEVCERNLNSVTNDPNRCALAGTLKETAINYVQENKYDLAFPALKRSLAIWEKIVHPPVWAKPSTEITTTRELLADTYRAQEKSKMHSAK
jgi:tetratricopeptide (TPR) repeat protein